MHTTSRMRLIICAGDSRPSDSHSTVVREAVMCLGIRACAWIFVTGIFSVQMYFSFRSQVREDKLHLVEHD